MLSRLLALAGLLLLGGCAYDAGYYESGYASQPPSAAGYYSSVEYATPYMPSSPVYGAPYVSGPVIGGIYSYGDETDIYGGPFFSPYHGIRCDRRRNLCWGQYGPDPRWTARFFGHRHADWHNGNWNNGNWHNGNWHNGNWHNGNWNHGGGNQGGGGWNNGGGNGHWNHGGPNNGGGPNPGGNNPNNNQPWVYQVPRNPDGRGAPIFFPN